MTHVVTDPAFITSIATLITAITALIKVFHVDKTTKDNNRKIAKVQEQTNGLANGLHSENAQLRTQLKELEDTGYPPKKGEQSP